MRRRQWSDLPPELITDIAERLGLLEVVRFRSICQAWNSASSTISAKIESLLNYKPWFLHYGYDSAQCQLVTTESGNITMNLPQLDQTTTCIASYEGWLLVFKQGGSMFFFRPFSKTKIDLPNFPVSELTDHVAAFSSPPTSPDCTVCVINRSTSNDNELELNLLCRGGGNGWIQHKLDCPRFSIDTIKCAAYSKLGEFSFLDHGDNKLKLSVTHNREICWKNNKVVEAKDDLPGNFYYQMEYFKKTDMMNKLGLAALHEDVSFSVCGTQTEYNGTDYFIYNEIYSISNHHEESNSPRKFKGVWIYPRFYQISPREQSW
ncbi:putative F-box domain-containing protein [Rosa chinensis]|uniref:Putative F-box domain-containing protein n=1 Tax=Rosa chinensis TaxID=74649 RepID=A0A2P6PWE1_ROSCH|nr:F-box protein At4g00893 [Rosa chinensis]PRQ26250.1 putative F-box domain-containing protein [Rosa chinensis]